MFHTELVWVQHKENLSFSVLTHGRRSVGVSGVELCVVFFDGEHVCHPPSPSLCSTWITWSFLSSCPAFRSGPGGRELMPLHALLWSEIISLQVGLSLLPVTLTSKGQTAVTKKDWPSPSCPQEASHLAEKQTLGMKPQEPEMSGRTVPEAMRVYKGGSNRKKNLS